MKKILYIESSPRKNRSHSINVTKKYLEKLKSSNEVDIKKIDLWDYELPEFDGDLLNAKYTAISGT
jgi:FMN-dependent NADH-azoreductase